MNTSNRIIGKKHIHFDVLDSTNEEAKRLLSQNAEDGTLITASHQTAGRGQFGRKWESTKARNIMMSVIIHPKHLLVSDQFDLNMAISLAIRKVVANYCDHVTVKWPNDIYVEHRKIAGILIQNFIQGNTINSSIIGIGLNVNQERWSDEIINATSLKNESGWDFKLEEIIEELCASIDDTYQQLNSGVSTNLVSYNNYLYQKEALVLFEKDDGNSFEGIIKEVDDEGRLVVDQDGQRSKYTFGSISIKTT